jgi:hypothetical protein
MSKRKSGGHAAESASSPKIVCVLVVDAIIGEFEVQICCQRTDGVDRVFSTSMDWLHAERPSEYFTMTAADYRMTRRRVITGAAASLICAPAIVRAASLMAVRSLPLQRLNPEGEFYRRCFYHSLENDLRVGRAMSVRNNEKIISLAEAHRMVARARVQGRLSPQSTTGKATVDGLIDCRRRIDGAAIGPHSGAG